MRKRISSQALYLSIFLLFCSWNWSNSLPAQDHKRTPNIILIMADDLGIGQLGCYGQEKIKTPHIDRLAKSGIRFDFAYAGSHVCQPSRSVLMTGQHTGHTTCRANDVNQILAAEDITMAEVLKAKGYQTGMFGKWGLGPHGTSGSPKSQGFDTFVGQALQVHGHFYYPYWLCDNDQRWMLPDNEAGKQQSYAPDMIQTRALQFIRDNQDSPFFLYMPSILPHVELAVPTESEAEYVGRFPRVSIQDPRPGYLGSEDGLATYAGMVSHLDKQVGQIVELLEELDIRDETLIIFTSDNGPQGGGKDGGWKTMSDFFDGSMGRRGYKSSFFEGGLRVPLIISWPNGIAAESRSDRIVAFWDFLPTLAEIVGATAEPNWDGISFRRTLNGQDEPKQHSIFYWEYPTRNGLTRAARIGNWKVIQARPEGRHQLYDLSTDPNEQTNLAADKPELLEELVELMHAEHLPMRKFRNDQTRTSLKDFVR